MRGGVARDGVQVERGAGSGQQRVLTLFWRSAGVCRDALEVRVVLARRKEARDVAGDGARLAHLEAEVRAEHVVDVVDDAALDHRMRTAHAFLCWLEAELDRAAQLRLEAGQQSGKSESDGRVAVVTAGVHGARMAGGKALLVGAVRSFRRLRHIIGVHVEAHGDDRTVCRELHDAEHARAAAVHLLDPVGVGPLCDGALLFLCELLSRRHAHHGVFADGVGSRLDRVAELGERLGYLGCRAEFRPARLWMRVQVTAAGHHVRLHIIGEFQDCLFQVHNDSSL